jgi:serpin B
MQQHLSDWLAVPVAVVASLALAGCGGSEAERSARQLTELTDALRPAVDSNNQLAWSLYAASQKAPGNTFFSPFSVSLALGMTYAGARGTTADELRQLLAVDDVATYHQGLGALSQDLGGRHQGRAYQLYTACKLFGASDETWSADFLELLRHDYAAPLQELDFAADPEAARQTINGWVEGQTQGKVPELLHAGDTDPATRFALTSAIYFDAPWATAFNPAKTKDASFTLADGTIVNVPQMTATATFNVAQDSELTLVELDYASHELSMLLLIPQAPDGLAAAESDLSQAHVDALLATAAEEETGLRLPRLELRAELPLTQALQDLGAHALFDPSNADLSGMLANRHKDLWVDVTRHQAYLKVDERGTEAAAATAVVGTKHAVTSLIAADHPFAFAIRDKLTSTLLFVGRIVDPR